MGKSKANQCVAQGQTRSSRPNDSFSVFRRQVIFQLALTILDSLRERLLAVKDEGDAISLLNTYLQNVTNKKSVDLNSSPAAGKKKHRDSSTVTSVRLYTQNYPITFSLLFYLF